MPNASHPLCQLFFSHLKTHFCFIHSPLSPPDNLPFLRLLATFTKPYTTAIPPGVGTLDLAVSVRDVPIPSFLCPQSCPWRHLGIPQPLPQGCFGRGEVSGASTASNNRPLCCCLLPETKPITVCILHCLVQRGLNRLSSLSKMRGFPITWFIFFKCILWKILPMDVLFLCFAIRCCIVKLKRNSVYWNKSS